MEKISELVGLLKLGAKKEEVAKKLRGSKTKKETAEKGKLGSGARFKELKKKLGKGKKGKKKVSDPGALAAWIGRAKHGKKKFQGLAAKARKKG